MDIEYVYDGDDEDGVFFKRAEVIFIINEIEKFTKEVDVKINENREWSLKISQLSNSIYEFSLYSRCCINMIRYYDFNKPDEFYHDTFVIDEKYQGLGLTYLMLRTSVSICDGLSIPKITINTILDGTVVWLKMGFLPRGDSLELFFDRLSKNGVMVDKRNHYWFTKQNIEKYKDQIHGINWSGFAYVEMIKEIL